MHIESLRIENFRCFKDTTITLDNYSCCVGANGAGKSTILYALNVFFRQYKDSKTDLSKLSDNDFHHKNVDKDIRITVTFTGLSDKAKIDLAGYVRKDKLVVTAVAHFNKETQRAEVKQYGNRLGLSAFRKFFELEKAGAKVGDLKLEYQGLQKQLTDLKTVSTKQDMIEALREFEEKSHNVELIPSEDQFYGATKGTNRLANHLQWVFVPAVKDVTEESEESKTSALGLLLSRTVRSKVNFGEKIESLRRDVREGYEKILEGEQSVLDEISTSIRDRLSNWAHPNINAQVRWKQDPDKSVKIEEPFAYLRVGERGFVAELGRFGHGLQRSFMLALLQELALLDQENAPTLIMGIEEPELYQHPPQARYLAETLIDLSEKEAQLIICTHNPLFIPGDNFDKIRIIRDCGNPSFSKVNSASYEDISKKLSSVGEKNLKESGIIAKLYPSLNPVINEMFFCKNLILVEGDEDVAYLTSYLFLTNQINEFRRLGCHIVPVNGKSRLIKPIVMAKLLEIPVYVVFDADTDKTNDSEIIRHKKDNRAILNLLGHEKENEWPKKIAFANNFTCWPVNLAKTIKDEFGEEWDKARNEAFAFYANAGELDKNPLSIAKTMELLWEKNFKSSALISLIDSVLKFSREV